MTVSLTKLEDLRKDPSAFKAATSTEFKGGYSMFQALQHAALHYHKTGSRSEAEKYLRDQFTRNFKSPKSRKKLLDYLAQLYTYTVWFEDRKFRWKKRYYNLSIDLPDRFPPNIICTGQIPLLSFKATLSYWDVLFYTQSDVVSRDELRLPLIQKQICSQMVAEFDEVTVSFYNFRSGSVTSFQFTENEMASAASELENLLDQIR